MGDKELLDLAADAAGLRIKDATLDENTGEILWLHVKNYNGDKITWQSWNPLTDDGDALRLANHLCMSVSTGPCTARATTIAGVLRGAFFEEDTCRQDQDLAVRRVIVRCAAEVGEAMP